MLVMEPADHARWEAIQHWKADRLAPRPASWWDRVAGRAVGTAGDVLRRVPGAAEVGRAVVGGLGWLIEAGAGPAAASVRTVPVIETHRARGLPVDDLAGVRGLPLAEIGAAMPDLRTRYAVGGAVQGVGSSLLASGGTIVTVADGVGTAGVAVAPGLGAVLTTMVLDAAVGVLVSQRAVARVAAFHGYDVSAPDERLIALGVLSFGLAEDNRRAAAYRELNGIAGVIARREAWRLTSTQAAAVVRAVSTSLALRLAQERLAKVVPVLGTVPECDATCAAWRRWWTAPSTSMPSVCFGSATACRSPRSVRTIGARSSTPSTTRAAR
jgi:hypothetical protein